MSVRRSSVENSKVYETLNDFLLHLMRKHIENVESAEAFLGEKMISREHVRYVKIADERTLYATTLLHNSRIVFFRDIFPTKNNTSISSHNFVGDFLKLEGDRVEHFFSTTFRYPPVEASYKKYFYKERRYKIANIKCYDILIDNKAVEFHCAICGNDTTNLYFITDGEIDLIMLETWFYIQEINEGAFIESMIIINDFEEWQKKYMKK